MGYLRAFVYLVFKESIKRKTFYGTLLLFLLTLIMSRVLMSFALQDLTKSLIDFSFAFLKFFIMFIALFVTADIMADDLRKRTVYILLSKNITREEYIYGRFTGILILLLIATTVLSSIALLFSYINNLSIQPAYKKEIVLINIIPFMLSLWIKSFLLSSVVIFFFSFIDSYILIIFSSLIVYMAGSSIENIYYFVELYSDKFTAFTRCAVTLMFYLLPNMSSLSSDILINLAELNISKFLLDTLKSVSYSALLILTAGYIFKRRDL